MVDQGPIRLVADGGDQRHAARRRRPHHDLLVEAPQILERAAAARDDDDRRTRQRAALRQGVQPFDRAGHFRRARLALHAHRPDQDPARKTVGDAMQDVADDGAGRRGDDADDVRQIGNGPFARLVEKPLGGELAAALLDERHQRADAGGFELFDDDLIGRFARKRGDLAGGDDLEPFLRLDPHAAENALPDHRIDAGVLVLEARNRHGRRNAARGNWKFRRAPARSRSDPRSCVSAHRRAR